MERYLFVALGGALGSTARYATGVATTRMLGTGWPYGTFTVNIVGGLLMGLLAGFQPRVGLGARAIDADLARAEQLVDLDMVQVRPAALEPAVQAYAVLARVHIEGADLPHANSRRTSSRPANSAVTDSTTEIRL